MVRQNLAFQDKAHASALRGGLMRLMSYYYRRLPSAPLWLIGQGLEHTPSLIRRNVTPHIFIS